MGKRTAIASMLAMTFLLSTAAGSTASPATGSAVAQSHCPADFWLAPDILGNPGAAARDKNDNGFLCVKRQQADPGKLNAVDDWMPEE